MANIKNNKKGQFTIIAALLVAVILVGTLVTTYSAIQSTASSDQPQVLSSVDETNLALRQLLGFTVGYYGSILKVTGNTSYAQNLASIYLNSGLENIADSKPELGLSFKVTNLNLNVKWFMTSSYSSGSLNVTYDISSLGLYGLPYFIQSRLDVEVLPSIIGGPAIVSIIQDGEIPLNTLTRQNFKFYRYQNNLTTWDLVSINGDPQVFSNGTYLLSVPPGYGIDSTAYLLQVTDTRGVNVIGSSFNGYSSTFVWNSAYSSSEQFVTQPSNVDGSADKGSHSVFNNQKAKDGSNDVLTEQNTGANIEQFVTQPSNVDGSADKGSHSVFNNQKAKDGTYDVLIEQNTGSQQSTFGNSAGTSSYTITSANNLYGSPFNSPADSEGATINNIIWYGRTVSGSGNAKAVLVDSTRHIIAVSNPVSVSTTATDRTCSFSSPPIVHANTQYYLMMIFDTSTRFYYQSTSNQGLFDTTNSYSTPSNPTDGSTNSSQYHIQTTYQKPVNYVLDLEEQFTGVDFSQSNEWLCVYAGALGSESLKVDVYSGGSWVTVIPSLVANQWNNVSVSSYLTSGTFTIRFKGAVESGDAVQDTWQVDAVLLRLSSTVDPSSIQDSIITVEWIQNGTMRMLGQGLAATSQAFPIPPIPIKAIHLNQTFINGTNREIPFQIESWGSNYNIPLGLTNNATVFSSSEMVVFLLDTKVSRVTMWWNGSDMTTQTPYAYTSGSFNDNPVFGGTLSNSKITLQFPSGGFNVVATTVGGTQSTSNFMRINGETSNYGAGYAFVVHHGVVRDIVLQEPEWGGGAGISNDCPNIYCNIVLTLPAGTSYYTYQMRLIFINSTTQTRTISDLSPVQLTTTLSGVQSQTENGTSTIAPIVTAGTGTFTNYNGTTLHQWSQFINSAGAGTGMMFKDLANKQLYFFDAKGSNPALTGALNVSDAGTKSIELAPVSPLRTVLGYNTPSGDEVSWIGAIATFDSNMTPIYTINSGITTGLWLLVEYSPIITVTPMA
jgi:hypothetical protein